ncbi:vacuolar protein sorting-associated protein 18, putative (VPS18) [Plasmodium ovale wallikeri]|uniref:Vacuolar protein sorting-associated protein 18, putative n=2 Tax=Plasmodium ovale TaxID=36330 RepID=A0A1C3L4J4_PLAOA|nr:vacuolar protein sorting-associated protein 18, putative (VPS18) [Plasmodium ovale wallikeri]SBT47646.1 vacuolar protein sorting-associated protein 18, putative (VPS18) [Plasmodium ovale wallikeri]SBT82263.1 vacuolar protein sorting-associated protein 18, putative [Plasmodium ovale]
MNKSDKKFILKLFKIKNGNINLLKNRITHFSINNKCIHIVLCNNTLIKYYVEENELSYIDFYNKKTTNNKAEIRSMFFDGNCYHGFICLANKEYIYVHFENNIVRNLAKLKKYNITSLCFNDYTEIKNTFPFLIATKDGEIIEMCINNRTKNNKDHEIIFSNEKLLILDIGMINMKMNNSADDEMLRIIYFTTSNSVHEISYTYKNNKMNNSEKNETNVEEFKTKMNNFNTLNSEETKVYECCVDSLSSILKIENIRNQNYLFWLNGCCIFISKINNYKKKRKGRNSMKASTHMKNKLFTDFDDIDCLSYSSTSDNSEDGINLISPSEDEKINNREKNTKDVQRKRLFRNNHHYNRKAEFEESDNISRDLRTNRGNVGNASGSNVSMGNNNVLNMANCEFYLDPNYVIVNFLDLRIFTSENLNSFSFTRPFYESMYKNSDKKKALRSDDAKEVVPTVETEVTNCESANYDNTVSVVVDMCVNDFYIFLLLEEKLIIISNVNFKKVYDQKLAIETYGNVIRVMKDNFDNQVWLCTSKYIFKIHINKNRNDMLYFNLKKKQFSKIMENSTNSEKIKIKKYLLKNNKYEIDQYKYTNVQTEEILISFLYKRQYFLLSTFLYNNIHCYNSIVRIALFIWLIQLYVYSIDLYSYLYRSTFQTFAMKEEKFSVTNAMNNDKEQSIFSDCSSVSSVEADECSGELKQWLDNSDEGSSHDADKSDAFSTESSEGSSADLYESGGKREAMCENKDEGKDEGNKKGRYIETGEGERRKLDKFADKYSSTHRTEKVALVENENIAKGTNESGSSITGEAKCNTTDWNKTSDGNKANAGDNRVREIKRVGKSSNYLKNNKNAFISFFEKVIKKDEKKENKYNFDFSLGKKMNIKTLTESDNFYILLKIYKMKNNEIFNFLKSQKYLIHNDLEKYKKMFGHTDEGKNVENSKPTKSVGKQSRKVDVPESFEEDAKNEGEHTKVKRKLYRDIYSYKCLEVCIYIIVLLKHFKNFFQLNEVILEIFQKFHRVNFLLLYKYICNDYNYIVNYYINNNKYNLLFNVIVLLPQNVLLDVLREYAFLLYLHKPKKYVDMLLFYDNLIDDYTNVIICMFIVIYFFKSRAQGGKSDSGGRSCSVSGGRSRSVSGGRSCNVSGGRSCSVSGGRSCSVSSGRSCSVSGSDGNCNRNSIQTKRSRSRSRSRNRSRIYQRHTEECIRFLEHVSNKLMEESTLEKKENYIYTFECTWKNNHIINCLLILYIEKEENEKITKFLNRLKSSSVHFDYLFIIRFLKERKKENFIPHIYILMKYYEEAVDKSLELCDYLTAKNAVILSEDEEEKKKLFLKIIKHISKNMNDKNFKEIINLIQDSNSILNLHDILPYINENIIIDYLKKDICSLLDIYNLKIKAKKEEIKENLKTIQFLNNDINDIKKKYIVLNKNDICYICKKTIYYKKFYVFSCNHYFHSLCSLIIYVNSKSKEDLFQFFSILHNYKNALIHKNEKDILVYEMKIDDILTEECFICGSFSINSITKEFISENQYELVDSWAISKD